jgi:hypothetical protein
MNRSGLFVTADFHFELDGIRVVHQKRAVSSYGSHGMPWHPLRPKDHFAQKVRVAMTIPAAENQSFQTDALILREQTVNAQYLGLRFLWSKTHDPEQLSAFKKLLEAHGHLPPQVLRKFPRIPFLASIDDFPVRAIVFGPQGTLLANQPSFSLEISNISPNGLMVRTQNPHAPTLRPGQKIDLVIEPRHDRAPYVEAPATVRRVLEDQDIETGEIIRYYGLQIDGLIGKNEKNFKLLLRQILTELSSAET